MESHAAHDAAMEQINRGAEVPKVDPSLIESMWNVLSSIPPDQRRNTAVGLGAVAGANASSLDPEQLVALLTRMTLLNGLSERGVLDELLTDESLKKRLFVAVASVPCNKKDLAEALAGRVFREATAEEAQKFRDEMREAGLDPDFPNIARKLIRFVRDSG